MRHFKILRIAGLHYQTPIRDLYRSVAGLESRDYKEQQRVLFQNALVYSDSVCKSMCALGHDAHEAVYDLEPMQKAWAREQGVQFEPTQWQQDIVLAQIEHLKPDVVYFQHVGGLPYSIRKDLKKTHPSVKLVVIHTGYPVAAALLDDVDLLFVANPAMRAEYTRARLRPHLLYHAFDNTVYTQLGIQPSLPPAPRYDFTFVGSSGFAQGIGHCSRYWAIVELLRDTGMEAWIEDQFGATNERSVSRRSLKSSLRHLCLSGLKQLPTSALEHLADTSLAHGKLRRATLEVLNKRSEAPSPSGLRIPDQPMTLRYPDRCHPPVYGLDMYQILRDSKITFNMHTNAVNGCVGNMRMFQATGMGTCLLTDTGSNISDLFEPDREIVTYSSVEECKEKAKYLLEHEETRLEIAAAGQRRTLRDHTVLNRCQEVDALIQQLI